MVPIGREAEFETLVAAAEAAAGGQGSILFVSGPTGSGKSHFLKAFVEELGAGGREPAPEVVSVLCYEQSAGNPLGPFGEVLRSLTSRERRGDRAKRVLEIVGKVAPPLVELIPVVGKLAALGVKTAADVGVYALGGDHEGQQAQLAADVALALEGVARQLPLVVVVDDAHWIDAPSTEVIARLAPRLDAERLLLVIAYDGDLVDDRRPLARLRSSLAGRASVRTVTLGPLGVDAVAALVRDRYGDAVAEQLAGWLHERADGSPLFVKQHLDRLQQEGVLHEEGGAWILDGTVEGGPGAWRLGGALAQAGTPDTLLELLRPRVADLDDEERSLLETGAVQGRRFLSTVLVTLLEREEDEILERLARIEERRRMIVAEESDDWWSDRSNLYAFDPGVVRELLYGRYAGKAYERRKRHRAVAEALEALIAGERPPPRLALLEIAHHYEEAGDGVAAARRLVEVAESTLAEGADRETAANADRAVDLLRGALAEGVKDDVRPEAQRLFARAAILFLVGGEASWRSDPEDGAGESLLALAEEAERAAEETGDTALRANARYATAMVLTGFRGLHEAIAAYRDALALAREAGDPVSEFAVLRNLGHQVDSVSLEEGWGLLQEAHALLAGGALADRLDEATLELERARLENVLGVAAFDLGRFGEARELLVRSADALRARGRRDDSAWALAFLGQLETATGRWEDAEAALRAGIDLFEGDAASFGIRGYLRALLGRLYLEWEPPRPAEARAELEAGRAETVASGYRGTAPLVEAFWAELLLEEGTPEGLREADRVLEQAPTFGWLRSEIAACSLRGRVALAEGRVEDAVGLSTKAVEKLGELGGAVPTVRSEEILHAHAGILAAAGSPEAAAYAAEAARVVRAKADAIADAAERTSYVERVRLSRAILAAEASPAGRGADVHSTG